MSAPLALGNVCDISVNLDALKQILKHGSMEILCLNFGEGSSEVLLSTPTPDTNTVAIVHPRISGVIGAVGIRDTNQILLIDWRKQSCVVLLSP